MRCSCDGGPRIFRWSDETVREKPEPCRIDQRPVLWLVLMAMILELIVSIRIWF